MTSSTEAITQALQRLDKAKESYLVGEAKSTEAVLDAAQAILVAGGRGQGKSWAVSSTDNEKPSDFLQRVMWAESNLSPLLVVAVQTELFQKLREAGSTSVSTDALAIKSPYHEHQLERILRHLKASSVIDVLAPGVWLPTPLSNKLATPHFQHSILFCHYTTRQAFNGLPEYFTRMTNEEPSAVPGPFQLAHCDPAYERTERAWRDLLSQAGYVVTGIFGSTGAAESVIEAEIAA